MVLAGGVVAMLVSAVGAPPMLALACGFFVGALGALAAASEIVAWWMGAGPYRRSTY